MPQENAATQQGAAEGDEKQPLTHEQIEEIKQEGYKSRLNALDAIKVDRSDIEGDPEPVLDEDEEVERQRIIASTTDDDAAPDDSAAAQVAAAAEDEEIIIDLTNAAKVKFRTKVDGREEVVAGDKVLARYQKDSAADVRLARATEAQRSAEATLAEANKKLAEANSVAEKKAAETAVATSKDKLSAIVKESFDALYGGDQEKATELLASGFTDVLAATLTSRGQSPANSSVDAGQVVAEVEQRIEVKGALNKLFELYPDIKTDHRYASLADMVRAEREAEGLSRPEAILAAGEVLHERYGLRRSDAQGEGKNSTSGSTTLAGKRAAKEVGTDQVPRAGSIVSGDGAQRPPTTSQVIADMASQRRGGGAR